MILNLLFTPTHENTWVVPFRASPAYSGRLKGEREKKQMDFTLKTYQTLLKALIKQGFSFFELWGVYRKAAVVAPDLPNQVRDRS